MGDQDNGIHWFAKLCQDFPDSNAGNQSRFLLGKTYCELKRWDKASSTFSSLSKDFSSISLANLRFIAGKLFEDVECKTLTGINAKTVIAANKEIVSRCESNANIRSAVKEQALYRIGQCEMVMKNYKKAIAQFNELTSPNPGKSKKLLSYYYFDAMLNKAVCLRSIKHNQDALMVLTQLNAQVNKNKFPKKYYTSLLETGKTLLEIGDRDSVRKSIPRFLNIMTFADIQDAHQSAIIEQAYYRGAAACIKINDNHQFERIRKNYLSAFPEGKFKQEINTMKSKIPQ